MNFQNKLIQAICVFFLLIGALWLTNQIVDLPVFYQLYAGITIIVVAVILLVARKVPFDFKVLSLLLLGYSFAGKGFAYITPVEPFYIGEITLTICLLGYLIRCMQGAGIFPTRTHWIVFMWMATVAIYLMDGIPRFGMMAIRDSVMGYYALFFFIAYALFQRDAIYAAATPLFKWMIGLGMLSCFIHISTLFEYIASAKPIIAAFFLPHADSYVPLVCAAATVGIIQGTTKRNIKALALGLVAILLLLVCKTAGLFSFAWVLFALLIFGRRVELLFAFIGTATLGAVAVAMLIVGESKFFEEKIMKSDQIQTFSEVANARGTGNDSTSDWRVTWWKTIAEDTMETNPLLGTGLGSDITTHFLEITFGNMDSSDYARYPHSIIFNIFGRMGFLGLAIFLVYYFSMIRFSIVFLRAHFSHREIDSTALMAFSIFFSGMGNSLVQSTYEVPFGAIIHWVALAYMAIYHYRNKPTSNMPYQPLSLRKG